ncbi:MAG: YqjK-like family protein [Burkholderiales bacterium]
MQNESKTDLVEKIAREREELASAIIPVRMTAEAVERKFNTLRYIATHPLSLVVGAALILVLRPRGMGKWLRRAGLGYGALKALKPAIKELKD